MDEKLIKFVAEKIMDFRESGKKNKNELIKTAKTIITAVRLDLAEKLKKSGYLSK